jgi:hypothetical protein
MDHDAPPKHGAAVLGGFILRSTKDDGSEWPVPDQFTPASPSACITDPKSQGVILNVFGESFWFATWPGRRFCTLLPVKAPVPVTPALTQIPCFAG